jgi:hypothetical protein
MIPLKERHTDSIKKKIRRIKKISAHITREEFINTSLEQVVIRHTTSELNNNLLKGLLNCEETDGKEAKAILLQE